MTNAELEVLAKTVKKLTLRAERFYRLLCRLNERLRAVAPIAYYDHGDGYCTSFFAHSDDGSFSVGACKVADCEAGAAPTAMGRRLYRAHQAWRKGAIAMNQADAAFKQAVDEFAKAMVA